MKKIDLMIWAMALLLTAAACGGIEPVSVIEQGLEPDPKSAPAPETAPKTHIETVCVGYENVATKVTVGTSGGMNLGWSPSDALAVYRSINGFQNCTIQSALSGGTTYYTIDVELAEGESRTGYAVYPPENLKFYRNDTLMLTLPASYSISDRLDDTPAESFVPLPLIATNVSGSDLVFYQVGGLMRLIVNDIPVGTTTLLVDFGKRITGDFAMKVPTPGTSVIAIDNPLKRKGSTVTFTVSESATGLSAETDAVVVNIPVPTGTYTDLMVVARDAAGTALAAWADHSTTRTFQRRDGRVRTIALTKTSGVSCVSAGDGFEVSKVGKKFYFSPGNLANMQDSTGTWFFLSANNGKDQLRTIMDRSEELKTGKPWDLFIWGEMYKYFMREEVPPEDPYVAPTIDPSKTRELYGYEWRMPTRDEWHYFVGTRDYSGGVALEEAGRSKRATVGTRTDAMYAKVRVRVAGSPYAEYGLTDENYSNFKVAGHGPLVDVPGMMLFPDGYTDYTGSIEAYQVNDPISINDELPVITYENFVQMAEAGVIFLPSAGYYTHGWNGWDNVGYVGYYWTADGYKGAPTGTTVLQDLAYRLAFFNKNRITRIVGGSSRDFPRSVRLFRSVDLP